MIDPDFFGCSSKLSFKETERLSALSGTELHSDYSKIPFSRQIASVDRISRCATDWQTFADIALNHALGDIEIAGAQPAQFLVSLEFGPDADEERDRAAAARAFAASAAGLGASLGKCHSAFGCNPTSATVTVIGASEERYIAQPQIGGSGAVVLTRPLGYFKMHYLKEMGIQPEATFTQILRRRRNPVPSDAVLASDVSGHGLAGCLLTLARELRLDIEIQVSVEHTADAAVLEYPVECLLNPADSYTDNLSTEDERSSMLVRLRETAGPFVLLGAQFPFEAADQYATVGRYSPGHGKVSVRWSE